MKLARLRVRDIGALRDNEYSFADRTTGRPLDVAIVTGAGSSGKTTLLEAIIAAKDAAGSYGPRRLHPELRRLVRRGCERGRVEATWLLDGNEIAAAGLREAVTVSALEIGRDDVKVERDKRVSKLFAQYSRAPASPKFDYFDEHRCLRAPGFATSAGLPDGALLGRLRLGRDAGKHALLVQALVAALIARGHDASRELDVKGVVLRAGRPEDGLGRFRKGLETLVPELRLSGLGHGTEPSPTFERRDGTVLGLEDLSATEQQGLLFALAFWHLELAGSVVLVDRPELHLHPQEHARFLRGIVALGAGNQIIAATTSEAIVQEASPSQVVRLVGR